MTTKKTKTAKQPQETQANGNVLHKSKIEPFMIGEQNGRFYILITDKLICRKEFLTQKAAEDYIMKKPWDLIINANIVIYQLLKEQQENEKHKVNTSEGDMVLK